jgi:hypothetical protein
VRNTELKILWRTFIIDSTNVFLLNAIPTVVSVSTFTAYILLGNNLTAAKVWLKRSTRHAPALELKSAACWCHDSCLFVQPWRQ